MSIRIQVVLVIEMTDEQMSDYDHSYTVSKNGQLVRAKDMVESVRANVLYQLENSPLTEFADVSIKER